MPALSHMYGEFDFNVRYSGRDPARFDLFEEPDCFLRFFILAAGLGVDVTAGIDPASVRLSSGARHHWGRQIAP